MLLCPLNGASSHSQGLFSFRWGTWGARNFERRIDCQSRNPLSWSFPVVGTGVDPVTSRFSGRIFSSISYGLPDQEDA
jgi:hypothetical protein